MDIADGQTKQKCMMAGPKVNVRGVMKPKIEGWILQVSLPSHPMLPYLSQVSLMSLFPL